MNLDSQVCNLDLSKRLHELGVRAPALFYWYSQNEKDWELHISKNGQRYSEYNISHWNYNAYTVGELGLILPPLLCFNKVSNEMWIWMYYREENNSLVDKLEEKTEADCRAKALIYCIENGLVEVEVINNA